MPQDTRNSHQVQVTTESVGSMGQLLLQGYCMLADGCTECMVPLMRNPEGKKDLCVHCGKVISVTEEYSGDKTEQSGMKKNQSETGVGEDTPGLLAARMIQGWKMLSSYCPLCATPLVEKRDEGIYCVKCDMPVRSKVNSPKVARVGEIEEEMEIQKSFKAATRDSTRIVELKKIVITNILEYMNFISFPLVVQSSTDETEKDLESSHHGKIVSQLSQCADIVSKIEGLSL